MKKYLGSIFRRGKKQACYRLYDSWEPSFDAELELAVASFQADEAFHRVFGEGRVLDERSIVWHFIGWVFDRRVNAIRHIVTVRKNKSLKAVISGSLCCGESAVVALARDIKSGKVLLRSRRTEDKAKRAELHEKLVGFHQAIEDKRLEQRMKLYSSQLAEKRLDAPVHFMIQMIAVDPDEQGQGHLRAMLARLIQSLQKISAVEYIEVTTYDKLKVELYVHLGFNLINKVETDDMKTWVLRLPLSA